MAESCGTFVEWRAGRPRKLKVLGWVVAVNGCHIWQNHRDDKGYGRARFQGRDWYVHRLRYVLEVGSIPDGMELDHYACDNGAGGCVNPLHCRPATHRENLLRGRGIVAQARSRTHCPSGHPLEGDNLVHSLAKVGVRHCRTCRNARARLYQRRKVAQPQPPQ